MAHQTTPQDVAALLENFADYTNPAGDVDPWFTLGEINQQFAWDDISEPILREWLSKMANVVTTVQDGEDVWRWLS